MNIAAYIDHTLLKPGTKPEEIIRLCWEAEAGRFAAVCVPPYYVALAKKEMHDRSKVATVIGFPFGYSTIKAKKEELIKAIRDGADELDLVINLCALFAGDLDYLRREILACLEPVRFNGKQIKVIIESGILSDEQIIACCNLYAAHKVDFLKTSTGYAAAGAGVHAVQLMRRHLPEEIKIKASGGIRTFAFAKELIDKGAARIGTSSGLKLLEGQQKDFNLYS